MCHSQHIITPAWKGGGACQQWPYMACMHACSALHKLAVLAGQPADGTKTHVRIWLRYAAAYPVPGRQAKICPVLVRFEAGSSAAVRSCMRRQSRGT
eukprot:364741-Chlamydomonas_euryale.AAC.18